MLRERYLRDCSQIPLWDWEGQDVPSTDCPKCNSDDTCEIVYGPILDKERDRLETYSKYGYRIPLGAVMRQADEERYDELAAEKKVYRSRRRVSPACRARHCNECKNKWGLYCPKCGSSDTCPIVYKYDVKAACEHARFFDGLSGTAVCMRHGNKGGDSPFAYMTLEPAFIGREPPADEKEHDLLAAEGKIHPGGLLSPADMPHLGFGGTTDLARHCNGCGNEWGGVYCPRCDSTGILPRVYGYVVDPDFFRLADEKKIEPCGCTICPMSPTWRCKRCWHTW